MKSHWIYIPHFLSQQEADALYAAMESFPWLAEDEGKFAVHFGKTMAQRVSLRSSIP